LKNTIAPIADAIGAVASFIAASIPAEAVSGISAAKIKTRKNLVIELIQLNFVMMFLLSERVTAQRSQGPLKSELMRTQRCQKEANQLKIALSDQ
jgi:hypothetical protein